jgi:hypothetical protein
MRRRLLLLNARRGLGNRLRSLLSAFAYADATGCGLRVVWEPNEQCGAKLGELWEHPARLAPVARARYLAKLSGGWEEHLEADDLDLSVFRRPILALHSSQPFSNPAGIPWHSTFSRLRPVQEIRTRIARTWSVIDPHRPLVGVMVRAHSSAHRDTAASEPVVHALERLRNIREVAPDAAVFLSSDSPEASSVIRAEHSVIEVPAKGPFNSLRGVQDAVCDLYLLASCQWIIGSHASSFSEIAGLVAGHGGYETSVDRATARLEERVSAPRRSPSDFWFKEIRRDIPGERRNFAAEGSCPEGRHGGLDEPSWATKTASRVNR